MCVFRPERGCVTDKDSAPIQTCGFNGGWFQYVVVGGVGGGDNRHLTFNFSLIFRT